MCMCHACGFAFCVMCKKTWHGVASCDLGNLQEVIRLYVEAGPKEKEKLEARYGKRNLYRTLTEFASIIYLKGTVY